MNKFYSLAPDGASITCHTCGVTSTDPEAVRQLYCPVCHAWHQERELEERRRQHLRQVIASTLHDATYL